MSHVAASAPADVVDFLTEQHRRIESLFVETLARCGSQRAKAFFTLRRFLAVHEAAEAQIIHTRAERALANGHQVVRARRDEEHEANAVVAELEALDVNTDEFAQRLNRLRKSFAAHADREERGEFAELRHKSMTHESHRVARVVEVADAITPDWDGVSLEPELTHLLVGSLAAMTERASNLISGLAA